MHRRLPALALVLLACLATAAWGDEENAGQVGDTAADFTLQDFRGKEWSLSDFAESDVVVLAFVGTECPIAKLYAARLAKFGEKHADRGVRIIAIDSNQQDSITELAHFARVHGIDFPVLKDAGNRVADALGARRTPEVFVLDKDRAIRYRGRIDDQYTYGRQRSEVNEEYLAAAVDAVLAGREVAVSQTEAVGCHIGRVLKADESSEITYSRQISRILQAHCVECHRRGQIAPFALTDYDEVVGWAEMIDEVVREQRMPPWHASPEHGEFKNDARLSDEEKETIYKWVAAGGPEGDPAELPPAREFVVDWRIGEPDQVIYMAEEPFSVPAQGTVDYKHFVVDPGWREDKWIKAAECRPGNRAVVHHIIVAAHGGGSGGLGEFALDSDWLAAMAPGFPPQQYENGVARFVPAGSKLVFQMHYTPCGSPQEDRSSIGVVFADPAEVTHQVATHKAANTSFRIPAGAGAHPVESMYQFKQDSLLLALFPHMHLRGKSFRYTAIYPDRSREVLLEVPRYDFNWQNVYELAEPKKMPQGTKIQCEATFDNSDENLANPDPGVSVRWGDQTWEEMMIGYLDVTTVEPIDKSGLADERRTEAFLAAVESGGAVMDERLKTLAAAALDSPENLDRFALALREIVPQLDRLCWTTEKGGLFRVRLAAQEEHHRKLVGGAMSLRSSGLGLAEIIAKKRTVVHQDLGSAKEGDFQWMSRVFASSLHVPTGRGGEAGTINFWSTEREAFPGAAVKLLEQIAAAMQGDAPTE